MKRWLLAVSVLVGCTPSSSGFNPELTIKGDDVFAGRVAEAVSAWNDALYSFCNGPVFLVVEYGGMPVREYAVDDWPYGTDGGHFPGDEVAVKAGYASFSNVLVHELGHAIGLQHIAWDDDPGTVMFEFLSDAFIPTHQDASRAAEVLGCLQD